MLVAMSGIPRFNEDEFTTDLAQGEELDSSAGSSQRFRRLSIA
jgi:hypothetical protein